MSGEQKSPATKLEFEIYNLPFRLRAPEEEHDRLRRAARHVDTLIRDLGQHQTTPDTVKLALQTALLVSVDYLKVIDDAASASGLTDDVRQRLEDIISRLDEQLLEFQS